MSIGPSRGLHHRHSLTARTPATNRGRCHRGASRAEGECTAYLDGACAADSALRREVDSMVALDGQAQGFLETPALETYALALAKWGQAMPWPAKLSPITGSSRRSAPGGMGVVYKVQDLKYKVQDLKLGRLVALKSF